jgi:CRISPR-associated endonuclease Csn1
MPLPSISVQNGGRLVLGLDIGTTSVGWALVREYDGVGGEVVRVGTRIFAPPGNADASDIAAGRDESPGQQRRTARQLRRQHRRRAQRKRRLWGALVKVGLLPLGLPRTERADYLRELDREAIALMAGQGVVLDQGKLPYQLRAFALDHALPKAVFGRLLMQLGMRRGFLSNRRAARQDNEESVVLGAISDLEQRIAEVGARTLGEFLAQLDPREERIRSRWTARRMYIAEFEALLAAQRAHGLQVDDRSVQRIRSALFHQRPLKSVRHFTGRCELESVDGKGPRRCPMADPMAQEYRYLQRVNDLRVIMPDRSTRALTGEERAGIVAALAKASEATFPALRRLLQLPRGAKFNLEEGGETRLPGARTVAALAGVIGEGWAAGSDAWRDAVLRLVLAVDDDHVLERRLREECGLTDEVARAVAGLAVEPGYLAFSRRALRKLLPPLREGLPFATARKQVYGDAVPTTMEEHLPPVRKVFPLLRNPIVTRALTETRKVVNGLLAEGQRPDIVRIELARDLKRNRMQRERVARDGRRRERERDAAVAHLRQHGIEPTRRQVEKYLLWNECNRTCPYTGRPITFASLFGDAPEFDVEHIIPYSRTLDDSFLNKSLCEVRENRAHKRNRTPVEAYGNDSDNYRRMVDRVRGFAGDAVLAKVERFLLADVPTDLAMRHLNDTRFAATCAASYLARLFGGTVDTDGVQRVFTTSGGLTWLLRSMWELNGILSENDEKSRDDHRHHAIDAAVVAMTSPRRIRALQQAAERLGPQGARRLQLPAPWPAFGTQLHMAVQEVIVSQRVSRRVAGALHEQTHYGLVNGEARIRKPIEDLTRAQVQQIADARVRQIVEEALAGRDPKQAFGPGRGYPMMPNRNGEPVPIKRVRLVSGNRPISIGSGRREQRIKTGNNHHAAFFGRRNEDGQLLSISWTTVTLLEAAQRVARGKPVVQRQVEAADPFLFSLVQGDTIALGSAEAAELLVVEEISALEIGCRRIADARPKTVRRAAGDRIRLRRSKILGATDVRKLMVSPTGGVRVSND